MKEPFIEHAGRRITANHVRRLDGFGGWLLFFTLGAALGTIRWFLSTFGELMSIPPIDQAYPEVALAFDVYRIALIVHLCLVGGCFAYLWVAIAQLHEVKRPQSVKTALRAIWLLFFASLISVLLILASSLQILSILEVESTDLWMALGLSLLHSLLGATIWHLYLKNSKRVHITYRMTEEEKTRLISESERQRDTGGDQERDDLIAPIAES